MSTRPQHRHLDQFLTWQNRQKMEFYSQYSPIPQQITSILILLPELSPSAVAWYFVFLLFQDPDEIIKSNHKDSISGFIINSIFLSFQGINSALLRLWKRWWIGSWTQPHSFTSGTCCFLNRCQLLAHQFGFLNIHWSCILFPGAPHAYECCPHIFLWAPAAICLPVLLTVVCFLDSLSRLSF